MSNTDATKVKVQRILANALGSVRVDKDGDFIVKNGSAVVYVRVREGFGDDGVLVTVGCPMVRDVEITPELCRWVATDGQNFKIGEAMIEETEGNKGWVVLRHHLIADDLDESELMGAVYAVSFTADELDDEIHKRFGGEMFGSE